MSPFRLIALGVPVLNLVWWFLADLRARRLPRSGWWRLLIALFAAGNLAAYAWVFHSRIYGYSMTVPTMVLMECYVWHLVVLPLTVAGLMAGGAFSGLWRCGTLIFKARGVNRHEPKEESGGELRVPEQVSGAMAVTSRRRVLAAAVAALPPAATAAAQARAVSQLREFRIRRFTIELPSLPRVLDGMTIAHVSDLHVGRFTQGAVLRDVVTRTNDLRADLVLFTGDLIDFDLADLPVGIDTLRQLAPSERFALCEGNHDLFGGREAFENGVRTAGLPLLLNEAKTFTVRGERVQILGLRWGRPGPGRGAMIDEQMEQVVDLRDPAAFTILLAHHPQAFDRAAEAGIPLTLAGHTHGGQLMLTEQIGAGPLLFKYWSGVYRRGAAALAVSNGVGNWFPLRINAPAEILHITLQTAGRR